ncbi:UDP-N-acetylmuramoyl-L-alanyl-D-glutamate--2,6-diaminopimelate ligase [Brooklawnia cerclae]|uniref:UDP-N-acetylmuramoyl-L-alanyl-D-glutamate--2,6-diaminopimelate ligase n=2 Tax=Brooklawnia cerclae TaxID=349934 RepID=A0ABX0SJM3_9ACTN|nr:UDP-N-acetylmuramoyl-L-alanyl-D-glutamate--2,6-diaminopimelate ligase [Brooklawnia cerclae]
MTSENTEPEASERSDTGSMGHQAGIVDPRAVLRPRHVTAQSLSALLSGLGARLSGDDVLVSGVTLDSRVVVPGDLYVALPGAHHHGAEFAATAAGEGAVAVLTDEDGEAPARAAGLSVAVVDQPREVMAEVSARCYGRPTRSMTCFGVTGTNGKSTTVLMLAAALRAVGRHVGSIGTLGFYVDGAPLQATRTTVTTPEAPDLQATLAVMAEAGADAMAMEVSSHALALHRVDGVEFDVVGFTNLGRDHLDFHHTMESYFEAKARLFTPERARRAVINADDPAGRRLVEQAHRLGLQVRTVGFGEDADYRIAGWRPSGLGAEFDLVHDGISTAARIALPGEYNVRNAACALALLIEAGVDPEAALPGLATAVIPGRMQPVVLGGCCAPRVYVDFAHTPQAVASALEALNHPDALGLGRLIAVLGAGGDRDAEKRAPMGRAAVLGADVVVVTDDNPRSEDPASIRQMVLAGARETIEDAEPGSRLASVEAIDGGDRRSAIREALRLARPGDCVAILGKGHERTQQLADETIEFDDVAVAAEQWRALHDPQEAPQ